MRFSPTLFFIYMLIANSSTGQDAFLAHLYDNYTAYKEKSVAHQLLRQKDIQPLLQQLAADPNFEVRVVGQSVKGRDISLIKTGTGPTKVLMWSQMHGDEPTATMALWDMFNFLRATTPFESLKQDLFKEITLYVIPMLNPDGAEEFKRRNALDIDLNRDALRLQSPEAQILKSVRDSLQADFGFNLHDQSSLYSVGNNPKPATISFLAPAFNFEKDINQVRGRAMQLIVVLDRMLQRFIPGHVAKYDDTFEPRAFGDNIQKWGTSTVLVESGGYYNDPERQEVRKMNFLILMEGLRAITEKYYQKEKTDDYFKIPTNARYVYHLIVRNTRVEKDGKSYQMDIGVNHTYQHVPHDKAFRFSGKIAELGDMTPYYAYQEVDSRGMIASPGKTFPQPFQTLEEVNQADFLALLRQGFTNVMVEKVPEGTNFTEVPLNVVKNGNREPDNQILMNNEANFVLWENGTAKCAVVNGFFYDLENPGNEIKNALVY